MHITNQMEEFSRAYVNAIAAQAGCNPYNPHIDDDSIDVGFAMNDAVRPRLELQLKCTGRPIDLGKNVFPFDLSIKNYNDLRAETLVPRLLVVVLVPQEPGEWAQQTEEELCLHHCGYWYSLKGIPDTENTTTVRVQIPRANIFSVDFLQDAMRRIASGERL